MKIIFLIIITFCFINSNVMAQIDDDDESNQSELDVNELQKNLVQELNYIENEDHALERNLETQNFSETDEVKVQNSGIQRSPAVLDDDDLKALIDSNIPLTKTRRIRSR